MRLKKIKLAGFKSFVDPTTIPLPGNLIGIVGPNGCGKSNVIDAVRWVMGESSAKQLRGESMADVIFSGSNARKPVGKATVELIFDNADGSAPGQYAPYAEISIRREAGRDGQSDYFLNKTKCRRKDIIDLFLGTGAGPHAYSIIEQGMVTRIIESRPDDLRGFFEEAAGISRYKERRKETESRIKHTRENLSRVEDIRKELDSQLQRLQRQSRSAQRYKELKQEERLVKAQLLSLRWQGLNTNVEQHAAAVTAQETALEGLIAGLRSIEAQIEAIRAQQVEANEKFNGVQAEFYAAGAEIASLEQGIQHARDTHQQRQREQDQLNRTWEEASRHLKGDQDQYAHLTRALDQGAPRLAELAAQRNTTAEALNAAEAAMQEWQLAWEAFGQAAAEPVKLREIQGARLQNLERNMARLRERAARLEQELGDIDNTLKDQNLESLRNDAAERDRQHEHLERQLERGEQRIKDTQTRITETRGRLQTARGAIQSAEARLASLRELQAAALGKHDGALNQWLGARNLAEAPRLASRLVVEPGWEQAAERVLGGDLAAVCVQRIDDFAGDLEQLAKAEITLVECTAGAIAATAGGRTRLLDKVKADADVTPLLAGIFVAENLAEALALRAGLGADESVVTRNGVWVGRNWLAITDKDSVRAGMLGREREIDALQAELTMLGAALAEHEAALGRQQEELGVLEQERNEQRRQLNEYNKERAGLRERLGHQEAQFSQLSARRDQIRKELEEIGGQLTRDQAETENARKLVAEAEQASGSLEQRKRDLLVQRDSTRAALDAARAAAAVAGEALHKLEVERQGIQTAHESTRQSIARLEQQLTQLRERREELARLLAGGDEPEVMLKTRLEEFLKARLEIEGRLTEARKAVSDFDHALREQEQARLKQERGIQDARGVLEGERMARQELAVRRDTFEEQVRDGGHELRQVLAEMPAEAAEDTWHSKLEDLARKIERLGPINLVAIEEFQEQSERKAYLDNQYTDLTQALTTLEDAIRKIDRETRTRFKETFDKVNTSFQQMFPKLFGGGHAYLELVGDDLLDTGVTVMARPPGKRNSTIHLLSGGEKALTAVSLLFAIFELNPAPFCFLDEVDAPLDDANVARYADTLKALSQSTQLVYITHNKISMEIADVLVGVTMSEPGVSRLVAVDVEQALEMVAQ